MKKVLIIGCPGNGKSRLAKILGKQLNIPVIHLDQLFWKPNWVECPREEFLQLLTQELEKDAWIMDGNFGNTIPLRLQYADHVILLNYPSWVCYFRVLKRVITNYGKTRDDMTSGCNEKLDLAFMRYIRGFKKNKLPKIRQMLSESSVLVTEITSDKQLEQFLKSLAK